MQYFTIKVGSKYCLVKQRNHGPRFWLMNAAGQKAGYYSSRTADKIAQVMQTDGEADVMLTDEVWAEEQTTVQGGQGSTRFGGSSA